MQSPGVKDALGHGLFPFPIGQKGVSFTDVRDIAEVAVLEIQRRLAAREALGPEIYEVVAEDVLTGETGAELWSDALGRPIKYVGDDLDQWIQSLRAFAPNWMAYDFKYMMQCRLAQVNLGRRLGLRVEVYRVYVKWTSA